MFDLDDTLYPASSGLFRLVADRIQLRFRELLGLPPEEARAVQRRYWREYGTSLYGLMQNHDVDPGAFLEFVHDVPVEEIIEANPELRQRLRESDATHHLFTNGPERYARRVLTALGVEDCFEEVFDIARHGWVPKPHPEPYDRAAAHVTRDGGVVILIEDAVRNLPPARERGWGTIWLRRETAPPPTPAGESSAQTDVEADVTIDRVEEFGVAVPLVLEKLGYG